MSDSKKEEGNTVFVVGDPTVPKDCNPYSLEDSLLDPAITDESLLRVREMIFDRRKEIELDLEKIALAMTIQSKEATFDLAKIASAMTIQNN